MRATTPLSTPAVSVILPTCDDFSTIRHTIRALSRQTICDKIELVIVAPRDNANIPATEIENFHSVTTINGGRLRTSNIARSAGIRAASAPIVILSEDHSFPEPDWAESLLHSHSSDVVVVGPVLGNANPNSMVSWANLLLEYYPWLEGATEGEKIDLPGHNSSYNRDVLLSFGDKLEELLEVEAVVQRDIVARGLKMRLETKAKTHHLNFSRLSSSVALRFNAGRSFAGHRTIGWPFAKRISYIAGAPLIPLVRLIRILKMLRTSERYSWLVPRVIPMLCIALIADGLGELVGYISGPGNAPVYLGSIEFNRVRFMNSADKADYRAMTGVQE